MWTDPMLSQWAALCDGELFGDDQIIGNVSTDTRSIATGDIYVALSGDNFDGHSYVNVAIENGAVAVVVDHYLYDVTVAQIVVSDTRKSLGFLAGYLRDHFTGQVVALTGSAGKTSTRAMLERIMSFQPGLLATQGNFNNDIGVPKTWFRIGDEHQRVLLELGANAPGEIQWLGSFSKPHISLLLNAGLAHAEGFGGVDGVRKAKGEIIETTRIDGGCILNKDDPNFNQWIKQVGDRNIVTFGRHTDADVCLLSFSSDGFGSDFSLSLPDGNIAVSWAMLGEHMALNAAAAAATAWMAGISPIDIAEGLSAMQPEEGRLQPVKSNHGGVLIHDAYNANPASYMAAIDVLSTIGGDTLLIAGDMAELGEDSEKLHRSVGQYAKGRVAAVWTVGANASLIADGFGGLHFDSISDLLSVIPAKLEQDTAVLVKGSRSAGLERIVHALRRNN